MSKYFWVLCLAGLSLLTACMRNQDPNSLPNQPFEIPQVFASVQIGSVTRNFSEPNSLTCSLDNLHHEAVVTFSNSQNESSLSIRMSDIDVNQRSHPMNSSNGRENILIALGGDRRQNNYQMMTGLLRNRSSRCDVNYEVRQSLFLARFQCQGLVNSTGSSQQASGQWSCRVQPTQDWNW